jgi:hypothetical protein
LPIVVTSVALDDAVAVAHDEADEGPEPEREDVIGGDVPDGRDHDQ